MFEGETETESLSEELELEFARENRNRNRNRPARSRGTRQRGRWSARVGFPSRFLWGGDEYTLGRQREVRGEVYGEETHAPAWAIRTDVLMS